MSSQVGDIGIGNKDLGGLLVLESDIIFFSETEIAF